MMPLLLFLDHHLWLYRSVCGALVAATGGLAIGPALDSDWRARRGAGRPLFFLLALVAALFALRYPIFFYPKHLNADEAQMLAQAISYRAGRIPWADVDGGSGGPLDSYALLWCVPFGIAPTYLTGRIIGLACVAGMLVCLYHAGRRLAGEALARLAILPVFLFFAFASMPDWVHYGGEHLSLFLLGGSLLLLGRLWRRPGSPLAALLLGLTLGMLPFAKVQSVVPGAFLGLTAAALLTTRGRPSFPTRARRLWPLILGAALPAALLLSVVVKAGGWDGFWHSYVLSAGTYLNDRTVFAPPSRLALVKLLLLNRGLASALPVYLTAAAVFFVAVRFFAGNHRPSLWLPQKLAFAGFFFLVMIATVLFPGKPFAHYLLYLMVALPPLLAVLLRIATRPRTPPSAAAFRRDTGILLGIAAAEAAFLLFRAPHRQAAGSSAAFPYTVIPLLGWGLLLLRDRCLLSKTLRAGAAFDPPTWRRSATRNSFIVLYALSALALASAPNLYPGRIEAFLQSPLPAIDRAILRLRPPGGRLAVWGNQPEYYAETASVSGVRACAAAYVVLPGPMQTYSRACFLADMRKNRPELFIDTVRPGSPLCHDPAREGLQSFPALAALIASDYRPVTTVEDVRFFLRNDVPLPSPPGDFPEKPSEPSANP